MYKPIKILLWFFGSVAVLVAACLVGFKIWLSTWQTYKNDQGYVLKHPSTWKVGEGGGESYELGSIIISKWNLSFQDPGGPGSSGFFISRRFVKNEEKNIDKLVDDYKNNTNLRYLKSNQKDNTNFVRGSYYSEEESFFVTKYKTSNLPAEFIIFEKDGYIFEMYGAVYRYETNYPVALFNYLVVRSIVDSVRLETK